MENSQTLTKKILQDNESKSIRLTSIFLIFLSFIALGFVILNNLRIVNYHMEAGNILIPLTSTIVIFASLFTWLIPQHKKISSIILFIASFWMIIVFDYLFSYYVMPLILIPVILSTRYYDKKVSFITIIMIIVALFISELISYLVASQYPDLDLFAYKDVNTNYKDLLDVALNYVYKIVCLSLLLVLCYFISKNGRNLLIKQGDMAAATALYESDMKNASMIQNQVLPTDFQIASNDGIEIFASMKAAKEVAGDFYDFFKVDDNFYFLVGDVSDKGLYAAMFMMNVKNIIRSIALNVSNLDEIITQANKLVCKDNKSLMFVTIWIGQINTKTGQARFLNAGHTNALIKSQKGDIRELINVPQRFVGVFPNYSFKSEELKLEKGETVFLYTDGVTDAMNKEEEQFGEKGLVKALKTDSKTVKQLCDNVVSSVTEFQNDRDQFDDITMLALSSNSFDYDKEFPCDHKYIEEITKSLNEDLRKNSVNEDTINLVNSAIDDELDNIISYAYKLKAENEGFRFQYKISKKELKIVVTDKGVPFDPLKVRPADLTPDRELGGLGIHLIKSIMDEVYYSRTEKENILVLTKMF